MSKMLQKVQREMRSKVSKKFECYEWRSSIVVEGRADKWKDVVMAGKIAAGRGYKGVVNKIECSGIDLPDIKGPDFEDSHLDNKRVDLLIIGGGVIGCAIAREMSKWDISVLLVEKEEDLAMHTSSRNDGMIHPGFAAKPGTKKAHYNIRGNRLYSRVADELDIDFRRVGNIIAFGSRWYRLLYPIFMDRCRKNGVEGVEYITGKKLEKMEPNIAPDVEGGILFPSTGVLSPYKLTVAYGENAAANGVKISLNTIVKSMKKENGRIISVSTNRGTIYPKAVINAAGVYSDKIAAMADDQFFTIHPRKGQVIILDKKKGTVINHILAKFDLSLSSSETKGGGLIRTIGDNILVGPDAYEQPFREDYSTDMSNISTILNKHLPLVPRLSKGDVITYFSGIRASTYEEDFIIEKSEYIDNFIHAAGIQSPGLASAPAIAEDIEKIAVNVLSRYKDIKLKEKWFPNRKGVPDLCRMTPSKRHEYIKDRPDYGIIVCRCEEISRGEIIDAIHSPIPVTSVDGIKRRVRAGMGRCQGGFCMPLILDILNEEAHMSPLSVTKKGRSSYVVLEETKTCR